MVHQGHPGAEPTTALALVKKARTTPQCSTPTRAGIEAVPQWLVLETVSLYLRQSPRVLRHLRTTSKRFCGDLRKCIQDILLARLTGAPHPHLRSAALCSVAHLQTAASPLVDLRVPPERAISALHERLQQIFSEHLAGWRGIAFPHLSLLLQLGGLDALVTEMPKFDVHQQRYILRLMRCHRSMFMFRDGVWVLGESITRYLTRALKHLDHKDPTVRKCAAFYLMLTTPTDSSGCNTVATRVIQGLAARSADEHSEAVRAALVLALFEVSNG